MNEIKLVHKKLDVIKVQLDEKQYTGLPEPADTVEELYEIGQHDAFVSSLPHNCHLCESAKQKILILTVLTNLHMKLIPVCTISEMV